MHGLIPQNLYKSSSCENNYIPRTFLKIFFTLLLFKSIIILQHFLHFISFTNRSRFSFTCSNSTVTLFVDNSLYLFFLLWAILLSHSFSDDFESILNLILDCTVSSSVDYERRSAILEHSKRVQWGQMSLFVFFWNNPRFDSVENHVIDCDPVSKMNGFLHAKHTERYELNGC